MKKILPVNKDPKIRAYIYFINISSLCGNELFVNETLARFTVLNGNFQMKSQCMDHCESSIGSGLHYVLTADTAIESAGYTLEWNMEGQQEYVFRMDHLLNSNRKNFIEFSVFDTDGKDENPISQWTYYNSKHQNSWIDRKESIYEYPVYLKIVLENHFLTFAYSKDGSNWIEVKKESYEDTGSGKKLAGRMQFHFYENEWLNWLYTNFVQMESMINDVGIHLNYQYSLTRGWTHYYTNYFINFVSEDSRLIEKMGINAVDYLKAYLKSDFYIEAMLGEYYVKSRSHFQKSHLHHQNLIYGFDEEKECFLTVGIEEGLPCFTEIGFDEMRTALNSGYHIENNIWFMEYKPMQEEYVFNLENLKIQLRNYLKSKDSLKKVRSLVTRKELTSLGIASYDDLLSHMDILMDDIRISYIIKERMQLMLARLDFLEKRNYLTKAKANELEEIYKELYHCANSILSKIMYYQFRQKKSIIVSIQESLSNLKEKEYKAIEALLDGLEKDNN